LFVAEGSNIQQILQQLRISHNQSTQVLSSLPLNYFSNIDTNFFDIEWMVQLERRHTRINTRFRSPFGSPSPTRTPIRSSSRIRNRDRRRSRSPSRTR